MKKVLLIFSLITVHCLAQKQGNIWYFGYQAGLDFSSGTPVNLSGGQTGTDFSLQTDNQEGTSCISDNTGKILFYTGGKTIWNCNNSPMPNGTELMGGVSSTQSSLIVPLPGSDSIFYVFTSDEWQNYYGGNSPKGYRYSVVNMCLDSGNGDVINGQKNILLLDSSTEKLAACEDANQKGYWVVGHKMCSDEFDAWHLTSGGITNTVISRIGTVHGWDNIHSIFDYASGQGQMKINATGTKLALAISNFEPAYLDLFNFNNNTGVVSNFCHMVIDSVLQKDVYGVEFSPDGSKLYAALLGGSGGKRLYQYDITAGGGNCDSIIASQIALFQSNDYYMIPGMQLAPNGKIYVVDDNQNYNNLGCINYPNLIGPAANYDSSAVTLTTSSGGYTLPSFIAGYKYHNGVPFCSSKVIEVSIKASENPICAGDSVKFTVTSITRGAAPSYQWQVNGVNMGTNSSAYTYTPNNQDAISCVLTSNLTQNCVTVSQATSNTITMTVNSNLPVSVSVSAGTNPVCNGTLVTFTATATHGGSNPSYQWKVNGVDEGANNSTYAYIPNNQDAVSCILTSSLTQTCVTGSPAISNTITMTVNPNLSVRISVSAGTNLVCSGTSVMLTATPTNGGTNPSYQWQVNGMDQGTNSPTYSYAPVNNDEITCILYSNVSCPTNDPATSNAIIITVNNCSTSTLFVPNAFTPDNGGVNSIFLAKGENITAFSMDIYNRWGGKIFHTDDINIGWDGRYNGEDCPVGVYVYYIKYEDYIDNSYVKKTKSGTISLLR